MASLVLSGCVGSSGSTDEEDNDVVKPTVASGGSGTGKITGVVLDLEDVPVEQAQVGLVSPQLEQTLTVVTDAGGVFAFLDLAAGTYQVIAQKVGYRLVEEPDLELADGATLEVTLRLRQQPAAVPHQEAKDWRGIVSGWRVQHPVPGVFTSGQLPPPFKFNNLYTWNSTDDASAINAFVVEINWQNNYALTEDLVMTVYVTGFQYQDKPEMVFAKVEGKSPLRVVVSKERIDEVMAAGDPACALENIPEFPFCRMSAVVWPGTGNTGSDVVDFSLAIEQTFDFAVTTFYRLEPDPDYSYFSS